MVVVWGWKGQPWEHQEFRGAPGRLAAIPESPWACIALNFAPWGSNGPIEPHGLWPMHMLCVTHPRALQSTVHLSHKFLDGEGFCWPASGDS